MVGEVGVRLDSGVNSSNVPLTKFDHEENEFQVILGYLDITARNDIYSAMRDAVNSFNRDSAQNNHTLSSIGLSNRQEILAIGGVSEHNVGDISKRIMNAMAQKGYAATHLPQVAASQMSLA